MGPYSIETPWDLRHDTQVWTHLAHWEKQLPERERAVLWERLLAKKLTSRAKIGARYGISGTRVSNLEFGVIPISITRYLKKLRVLRKNPDLDENGELLPSWEWHYRPIGRQVIAIWRERLGLPPEPEPAGNAREDRTAG